MTIDFCRSNFAFCEEIIQYNWDGRYLYYLLHSTSSYFPNPSLSRVVTWKSILLRGTRKPNLKRWFLPTHEILQERFLFRNWYIRAVDWRESWLPTWVMIADVTHDCLHRAPQACRKNVGNNISFCGNVMTHDCRRESWLPTWLTLHSIAHLKFFLVKRSCAVS